MAEEEIAATEGGYEDSSETQPAPVALPAAAVDADASPVAPAASDGADAICSMASDGARVSPRASDGAAEAGEEDIALLVAAAEARLRSIVPGLKDPSVLRELAGLADSEALEALVLKAKPKASWNKGGSGTPTAGSATTKYSQDSAAQKAKNFGTLTGASIAMGGAGAGGGLGLNRPGAGPKVQHFAGAPPAVGGRGSIGGALVLDDALGPQWNKVQDHNDPLGWILCTYSADGKSLQIKATGDGMKGFKEALGDELAWGGIRCWGVDKRGGLECKRAKFINVQYKPDAASAIKKAKMGSHKGAVKGAMTGTHLDVVVESLADLEEHALVDKLQAATGAHKPNGYEFDSGVLVEADFYGLGIGGNCKGESARNEA